MNNNTLLIALVTLLIGGLSGYAVGEWHEDGSSRYRNDRADLVPSGMHRMADGTLMGNNTGPGMGMMGGSMMMSVRSEKEFITEMIPHHQEAVDTAKEVLARGATTPEMRALAEGIITAQEKEIADMKSWYATWYETPYPGSTNYRPMMRDLSTLSGAELDTVFLEDMVHHHMGAIMMAESVEPYIVHTEVRDLTKAIISTQFDEIQLMRQLRSTF